MEKYVLNFRPEVLFTSEHDNEWSKRVTHWHVRSAEEAEELERKLREAGITDVKVRKLG